MPDTTMDGITDETITVQVTAGQYEFLAACQVLPGRPRVTHKVGVGPFALPGLWVVVGASYRKDSEPTHAITLAKLA